MRLQGFCGCNMKFERTVAVACHEYGPEVEIEAAHDCSSLTHSKACQGEADQGLNMACPPEQLHLEAWSSKAQPTQLHRTQAAARGSSEPVQDSFRMAGLQTVSSQILARRKFQPKIHRLNAKENTTA